MSTIRKRYDGKVAVITGGASGIGAAIGHALAEFGCTVILADVQIELAETTADKIRKLGGKAHSLTLDVRDVAAYEQTLKQVVKDHGQLDFLFNNAGIVVFAEAVDHTNQDWQNVIDINLRGVVNGVQCAYPIMREQGFGHIINTASLAGLVPVPWQIAYVATKSAVVAITSITA